MQQPVSKGIEIWMEIPMRKISTTNRFYGSYCFHININDINVTQLNVESMRIYFSIFFFVSIQMVDWEGRNLGPTGIFNRFEIRTDYNRKSLNRRTLINVALWRLELKPRGFPKIFSCKDWHFHLWEHVKLSFILRWLLSFPFQFFVDLV